MNFAFISRYKPTQEQVMLAAEQGIVLHFIGEMNAFKIKPSFVENNTPDSIEGFDGVVVVNPAVAMALCKHYLIGVFEKANHAPKGAPAKVKAKAFYVYDVK